MTEHEKRIREALESHDLFGISLEDWGKACSPSAIRALLADMDAMRGALTEVCSLDPHKSSTTEWNAALGKCDASLKGASHD